MMQGYLTIATRSPNDIQIKQAAALAASIRIVDPDREICLLTDKFDSVPKKYEDVFDSIVEFPYGNYDPTEDIMINAWQMYASTPYEQTLFINRQTLVLNSMEDIWDSLSQTDIVLPLKTTNFKGEQRQLKYRYNVHLKNNVPTFNSDLFYFDKSERPEQFFKMFDVVLKDFRRVYLKLINENRPSYFDFNLLLNITLMMLGEDSSIYKTIPLTVLSLENLTLDDDDLPNDWTEYLSSWYSDGVLKINNHRQSGIICYNSDNFLEDEILDDLRKRVKTSRITV